MEIKMDSMQKYTTADEIEIPEGKVENICKQWLVHEDGGLAYKLQNEEIEEHLNHNKIRNQIVRSDLIQAKHIQQSEQQVYQQYRKQRQAQLDEQLAKELQLNLIEEEQKQMMEQQRISEEDEKYAKSLAEKEKLKMQRRKLAREQAQIEKIKRDRLQYYLDNNFEVTSTMNDDLDELDLSDFCMKPPDQLNGDQLTVFMAEQDEELARFLQIYENQKKNTLIKDQQELMENQDFEIARLIYEEEKAKLRRLKEKRLQKQRMKQAALQNADPTNQQPEYYIPDNRLYRLPTQSNEQFNQEDDQFNQSELLYDEPPQETSEHLNYLTNASDCPTNSSNDHTNDRTNEETNLKYLDDRPNSSNSCISNQQQRMTDLRLDHKKLEGQQIHYNQSLNQTDAQYTLSTKQLPNHTVLNFVNRALPPVPTVPRFHNIAMDIDPTYNKSKDRSIDKTKDSSNDKSNDKSKDKSKNKLKDKSKNHSKESSIDASSSESAANLQISNDLHFARLARVEDATGTEYDLVESNVELNNFQITNQINSQNKESIIHNQQVYVQPVQGQKRASTVSNQKKTKKDKGKDKCRQQ